MHSKNSLTLTAVKLIIKLTAAKHLFKDLIYIYETTGTKMFF